MRTVCSKEIFATKCRQQQIFDSDLKGAWHCNHVTFTPIVKNFMSYCRLIDMLSILCLRVTIKVMVGIPESFKVGWYRPKKTGSSHLNETTPTTRSCQTRSDFSYNTAATTTDSNHDDPYWQIATTRNETWFKISAFLNCKINIKWHKLEEFDSFYSKSKCKNVIILMHLSM